MRAIGPLKNRSVPPFPREKSRGILSMRFFPPVSTRKASRCSPRPTGRRSCAASRSTSPVCRPRSPISMPFSGTLRREPMRRSSIASSPRRITASAWRWIGSTSHATPTATDFRSMTVARCGPGVTGSSGPTIATFLSTASRSSNSPGIFCRIPRRTRSSRPDSTAIIGSTARAAGSKRNGSSKP